MDPLRSIRNGFANGPCYDMHWEWAAGFKITNFCEQCLTIHMVSPQLATAGRSTQKKFVAEIRAQCRREPSESEASGSRSQRQPARLLNEQSPARVSRGRRMSVDGRDAKTRLAVYKNAQQVACHLTNGNSEVYCSHPMCETRLWLHEEDIPIGGMSS